MKNEKMFIELPTELEVKREIGSIVERGLTEEKRRLKRPFLMTAATLIFSLVLLGFAFPTYASQIPVIGGVFETFRGSRGYEHLQEFAQVAGTTGEVRGLIITIEESVFDGEIIYFTYTIESEEALDENFHLVVSNPRLEVDGEIISQGIWGFGGSMRQVAEGRYVGVGEISLGNVEGARDIEEAIVHFRYFDWQASFPIQRTDVIMIPINEDVGNEGFEMVVTHATLTPIATTFYFTGMAPEGYTDGLGWDFFTASPVPEGAEFWPDFELRDDTGRIVGTTVTMGWGGCDGGYTCTGRNLTGYISIRGPIHPDARSLILTPRVTLDYVYLGDWRHTGGGSVSFDDVIANGGSWDQREVILGEIVIPLP